MNTFLLYLVNLFTSLLPETRFFGFKRTLYKFCGVKMGRNVRICSSVKILGNGFLEIGDNTWIGPQSLISSSSKIKIGMNTNIAPRVVIVTGSHEYSFDGDSVAGNGFNRDVIIGDGSWICAGSILLGGVILGKSTLVAAGAVVKGETNRGSSCSNVKRL